MLFEVDSWFPARKIGKKVVSPVYEVGQTKSDCHLLNIFFKLAKFLLELSDIVVNSEIHCVKFCLFVFDPLRGDEAQETEQYLKWDV
jgi:hypothetical protein